MPVTIKDVAKRVGLSSSTVSRAINKSGYVSEETQRLVDKAVMELDYRPNWMARGLKGKPSHFIGLIIPDISNLYYTAIARSVSNELQRYNYHLILCLNEESKEIDLNYLKMLSEKRVDGILYVHPANGNNSKFVRYLANDGFPIVELNRQRESDILDAVIADNFQGAYQMTHYLISKGNCRIGLIMGETDLTTGKNRLAGYQKALEDARIPIDKDLISIGSFTRSHGEKGINELLQLIDPPTAIFAGSNRILMGVLYVLGQKGLHIPNDISIVAFNDAEWLSTWNPPITVVDIATDEMARVAVEILVRRITSPEKEHKPITYQLSTLLIERKSCKQLSKPKLAE
jgi:LacI family transcriptional regulator